MTNTQTSQDEAIAIKSEPKDEFIVYNDTADSGDVGEFVGYDWLRVRRIDEKEDQQYAEQVNQLNMKVEETRDYKEESADDYTLLEGIDIKIEQPDDGFPLSATESDEAHNGVDQTSGNEFDCDVHAGNRKGITGKNADGLDFDSQSTQSIQTPAKLNRKKPKKTTICNVCNKHFSGSGNLDKHMMIHTGEPKFKCQFCGKMCLRKYDLTVHERIHTHEKPFKCSSCDKSFATQSNLVKHEMSHSERRDYVCLICEKAFKDKCTLKVHSRLHQGKTIMCDLCPKTFLTTTNLRRHQITHSGVKPYACNICPERFAAKSSLARHQFKHADEKPFACGQCERGFLSRMELRKHQQVHVKKEHIEPTLECEFCCKKFTRKPNLVRHLNYQHKPKRFQCQWCGKLYASNAFLEVHLKQTHSGSPTNYICEKTGCEKTLASKPSFAERQVIHNGT